MPPEASSTDTELVAGTRLLRGQYKIDCSLSKGGFGITYRARDSLNRIVVIKECFPEDHCTRRGSKVRTMRSDFARSFALILERFKREAFRLAMLDHPRIVGVHQIFEENGTAYLSMDNIQGADLFTIVEEHPERLSPPVLETLMIDALEALDYMHEKGLLHRDLAPDNFILGDDDHLTLIDFGSACEIEPPSGEDTATLLSVKDGYSPHEFYEDAAQDASSDMYSLAATFYYLITGYAPPDSQARLAAVQSAKPDPFEPLDAADCNMPHPFVALINQGLALDPAERLPSARSWLDDLQSTAVITEDSVATPAAEIDPVRISRLVSDTNHGLTPRDPAQKRQSAEEEREAARKAEEAAKPRQYVDIFGNPIDDVEAYLREQDKGRKKRKPKAKTRSKFKPERQPEPKAKRKTSRGGKTPQPKDGNTVLGRMADGLGLSKTRLTAAIPQS